MIMWLVSCIIPHLVFSAQAPSCYAISKAGKPGVPGKPGINGRNGHNGDRGSVGAPGKRGPQGPPGPKGAKGEQGTQAPQGNWKQCAWNNLNAQTDYGLIKDCAFMKHANDTALKVVFNGDFRICCCLDCCKRWYFTFNSVECRGPLAIDGIDHIFENHGKTDTNRHKTSQIGGYCQGIPEGIVQVGINVGDCVGKIPGDAFTGWNSVTRVMVEEFPPPQK